MILQPLYKSVNTVIFWRWWWWWWKWWWWWWWWCWQWTCVRPDLKCNTRVAQNTLWTFEWHDVFRSALTHVPSRCCLGFGNQRSWPLSCLYLSQNTFVNSIVSLCQHVFQASRGRLVWTLEWKYSTVKGIPTPAPPSSVHVHVNVTCAATGGRHGAVSLFQNRLWVGTFR